MGRARATPGLDVKPYFIRLEVTFVLFGMIFVFAIFNLCVYVLGMVDSSFFMGNEDESNNAPEFRGRCEDAPCCGCCGQVEFGQYDPEMDLCDNDETDLCRNEEDEDESENGAELEADDDCGGEDRFLDSFWESQTECDFGGDF